jgi:hypothetical protein
MLLRIARVVCLYTRNAMHCDDASGADTSKGKVYLSTSTEIQDSKLTGMQCYHDEAKRKVKFLHTKQCYLR